MEPFSQPTQLSTVSLPICPSARLASLDDVHILRITNQAQELAAAATIERKESQTAKCWAARDVIVKKTDVDVDVTRLTRGTFECSSIRNSGYDEYNFLNK